jgi:hypothetical protein
LSDLRQADNEVSLFSSPAPSSDKSLRALKAQVQKRIEKRGKPSSPIKNDS